MYHTHTAARMQLNPREYRIIIFKINKPSDFHIHLKSDYALFHYLPNLGPCQLSQLTEIKTISGVI